MKKILFIIFEYLLIKIVLTFLYIITSDDKFVYNWYFCWLDWKDYWCNITQYSFDSTFWWASNLIAFIIIFITIMIYLIILVIKNYKKTN